MKKLIPLFIALMFAFTPLSVMAAEFTGSVQGFNCVTQGKVCPVGMEDPVIEAEQVFVLLVDAAKNEYYFVPNVDRAVLARHINEQVKIMGNADPKLQSIHAKEIYTMTPDKNWKKVWTIEWRDQIYRDVLGSHPLSPAGE